MFEKPEAFLLLLFLIAYIIFIRKKRLGKERILFSVSGIYRKLPVTLSSYLYRAAGALPFVTLIFIIIALAGPRQGFEVRERQQASRDIIIALDASGSMAAMDFEPDRLEKAKETVNAFIKARPSDRIGLVVFSGKAFTHCPLTLDHDILMGFVDNVHLGMIEDGTAIGNALAVSVNRLRNSDAVSKTIILLTDGENNKGNIMPLEAAEMARQYGIRVHAIGIGSKGAVRFPVDRQRRQYVYAEIGIDEKLLQDIANITGGSYFFVEDEDMLKNVFEIIDRDETTLISAMEYRVFVDKSGPFKVLALISLFLFVLAGLTYFSTIP